MKIELKKIGKGILEYFIVKKPLRELVFFAIFFVVFVPFFSAILSQTSHNEDDALISPLSSYVNSDTNPFGVVGRGGVIIILMLISLGYGYFVSGNTYFLLFFLTMVGTVKYPFILPYVCILAIIITFVSFIYLNFIVKKPKDKNEDFPIEV